MVELARKRRHRRAVSLSLGDVCDIQQPGANHDTVVDFGIIHHVPQWQQAIAVITRVLRPGGQLLFEEAPRYMLDIWASRTFTVQLGENRCEADESPPNSPVTAFTARGSNNASADCSSSEPPARHGPRPHPDTASARTNPPGLAVRDYESRS